MINEIYKLYKKNFLMITFLIILGITFCFSLYMNYKIDNGNEISFNQIEYENFEEVRDIINDLNQDLIENEKEYGNGDINSKEYNERYNSLVASKTIYQYLLDNKIESKDIQMISTLPLDSRTRFNTMLTSVLRFLLSIVFIILPIIVIDLDFTEGTVNFVYTTREPKTRVIKNKILTIFCVSMILVILSIILVLLFSSLYVDDFKYIIDYCDKSVFKWSKTSYTLFTLSSLIIDTLPYLIINISVALLFTSTIKNLAICIMSFFLVSIIQTFIDNKILNAFMTSCFFAMNIGVSLKYYFIATILKYIVSIILFIVSYVYFTRKKDLV